MSRQWPDKIRGMAGKFDIFNALQIYIILRRKYTHVNISHSFLESNKNTLVRKVLYMQTWVFARPSFLFLSTINAHLLLKNILIPLLIISTAIILLLPFSTTTYYSRQDGVLAFFSCSDLSSPAWQRFWTLFQTNFTIFI